MVQRSFAKRFLSRLGSELSQPPQKLGAHEIALELKRQLAAGEIRPPCTAEAIEAFEQNHSVRLPTDMRMFYLTMDGHGDNSWNDEMFRYWPLNKVRPIPAMFPELLGEMHMSKPFLFSDFLSWCWAYAIDLGNAPASGSVYFNAGDGALRPVAKSFSEFAWLSIYDGERLY